MFRGHIHRTCLSSRRLFPDGSASFVPNEISNHVAKYILLSGQSFRHVESDEFQQFVKAISEKPVALPSRYSVKKKILEMSEEVMSRIEAEVSVCGDGRNSVKFFQIKPMVVKKSGALVVDFGKHVVDYLSVFYVYVKLDAERGDTRQLFRNESSSSAPELRVVPFAFRPTNEKKTALHVKNMIVSAAARFSISEDEIRALTLVSDGGANLVSTGKQFFDNCELWR